jgi:hypothetical protein
MYFPFATNFGSTIELADFWVVGTLQVMVSESKAKLWDSLTYFETTTDF